MAYTPTDNPYIPGDPYSYDLKWIVAKIKEALTGIEGLTTGQSDLSNDFEALQQYVYDYFNNLDISQEVEDKINELYADGFFNDIIEEWMNGHIKWTNPNLVMNGWFTVRQRGDGPFSGNNTYFADRWNTASGNNSTITGSNSGITWITTAANQTIRQRLPFGTLKRGEVYTLSFEEDGTIYSGTSVTIPATFGTEWSVIASWNLTAKTQLLILEGNGSTTDVTIQLTSRDASVRNIRAIKLEKGPYSTLANDAPPNYAEELVKCQRYFQRINTQANFPIATGFAWSATSVRMSLPIPTPMRAIPTITSPNGFNMMGNGQTLTVSSFTGSNDYTPSHFVTINAAVTGATSYQTYILYTGATTGYIDISADL